MVYLLWFSVCVYALIYTTTVAVAQRSVLCLNSKLWQNNRAIWRRGDRMALVFMPFAVCYMLGMYVRCSRDTFLHSYMNAIYSKTIPFPLFSYIII